MLQQSDCLLSMSFLFRRTSGAADAQEDCSDPSVTVPHVSHAPHVIKCSDHSEKPECSSVPKAYLQSQRIQLWTLAQYQAWPCSSQRC